MIIQATPYGTKKEEPFAFTYSGDFTDERVDGIGDVTLNTSGQLVTTGKTVKVTVYILGAGGGGAVNVYNGSFSASGGSGGYQTVEVELKAGAYEIVIGTGGEGIAGMYAPNTGGTGGDTIAFGFTSTGGKGGVGIQSGQAGGKGGTPNGASGATGMVAGGSPNGGSSKSTTASANNGGNGLVRITFS